MIFLTFFINENLKFSIIITKSKILCSMIKCEQTNYIFINISYDFSVNFIIHP